jgi:hypothetical protein
MSSSVPLEKISSAKKMIHARLNGAAVLVLRPEACRLSSLELIA